MGIDDEFDAVAKQYPKDEPNIPKTVSTATGIALTIATLAGATHLGVASAVVAAWTKLVSRDDWKQRTEETQALLIQRVQEQEPEHKRLDSEQQRLKVDLEDLKSAIRVGMANDGVTFDDRRRDRFISAIANATVSPSQITDVVSFIQDIDQLNEGDIKALQVLNRVMNKPGDWDPVTPSQAGMHPNTFLQRRQELAVQMAVALGKSNKTDGDKFSREEGLGLCLRLQGFGLAEVIHAETRSVPRTNYCARPTPRGLMLLRLLGEDVANWDRYFDEDGPI